MIETADIAQRTPRIVEGTEYVDTRELTDGRLLGVARLIYHWTLHVGVTEYGYDDRYCYQSDIAAVAAMRAWDGSGEPVGWHRHPASGRRRPSGNPAKEYVSR